MSAVSSMIIRALFDDDASAGMRALLAQMQRAQAAAARLNRATRDLDATTVAGARGIRSHTQALNAQTRAYAEQGRAIERRARIATAAVRLQEAEQRMADRAQRMRIREQREMERGGRRRNAGLASGVGGLAYATGGYGMSRLASLSVTNPAIVGPAIGALAAGKGIKEFAELEKATARVKKNLNLDARGTRIAAQDSIAIGAKYGMAPAKVSDITYSLAQSGIKGNDFLRPMTETVAMVSKVWDGANMDEVTDTFGRVGKIFNQQDITSGNWQNFQKSMTKFADAVNFLEESSPAKSSEIISGVLRSESAGAAFGLSATDVAATVGTMQGFGEPSGERAGSRMRILWQRLANIGNTKDKNVTKMMKDTLGMSPAEFEKMRKDSPARAQLMFFQKLGDLQRGGKEGQVSSFLGEFMGDEAAATTQTLVKNSDALAANFATTNDKVAEMVVAAGKPGGIDALTKGMDAKKAAQFRQEAERIREAVKRYDPRLLEAIDKTNGTVSDGSALREYAIIADTLSGSFDRASASIKGMFASLGEIIAPETKAALEAIANGAKSIGQGLQEYTDNEKDRGGQGTKQNSVLRPHKKFAFGQGLDETNYNPYGPSGAAVSAAQKTASFMDSTLNKPGHTPKYLSGYGSGLPLSRTEKGVIANADDAYYRRLRGTVPFPAPYRRDQTYEEYLSDPDPNKGAWMPGGSPPPIPNDTIRATGRYGGGWQSAPGQAPTVVPGPPQTVNVPLSVTATGAAAVVIQVKEPKITVSGGAVQGDTGQAAAGTP